MVDLMYYFDQLSKDRVGTKLEKNVPKRAPFSYLGGKFKSLKNILPHLPMRKGYIEVFGGSGVVLLNRPKTPLDVFNDRNSGVAAFYKCMHDNEKYEVLKLRIEETIHSREFWQWCHDTWESTDSDVDRAFKWFYTVRFSFGHQGRNFARVTKGNNVESGRLLKSIPLLKYAHDRFQNVIVENRDCMLLLEEYDNPNHVFYLDPPYLEYWHGAYKHDMRGQEHKLLLDYVSHMKAYVAISSYDNEFYDTYKWDDKITWEGSQCTDPGHVRGRMDVKEALYIKKERS